MRKNSKERLVWYIFIMQMRNFLEEGCCCCCWLFLRINADLAIFQPYLDLEAGDRFPSIVFWEKNGNGWVHNIESVTKLLKCNVFAQVIYQKIGNFLYFSIFLNMHPKFLIILEILTTKMAQKRAQKVQKIAEPRGFRSRILHCSA